MVERGLWMRWAVVVLATLPGCFCIPDFPTEPAPESGDGSTGAAFEEPRSECFLETLDFDFALDAGIPAQPPEGTSEWPLSQSGCYRYRRVVENGVLRETAILHFTGEYVVVGSGSSSRGANVDRVLMRLTFGTNTRTGEFDWDDDGATNETFEESFEGDLLTNSVQTALDPAGQPVWTNRLVSLPDGGVHFSREEWVDSVPVVRADFDAPAVQNQQSACYANSQNTFSANQNPFGCSEQEEQEIMADLRAALSEYRSCLDKFKLPLAERLRVLDLLITGSYLKTPLLCFSSKLVYASVDVRTRNPVLYVNRDMYVPGSDGSACESSAFRRQTMLHELNHLLRRQVHDPSLERLYQLGQMSELQMQMADESYACEALCTTPSTANKCSCARCLRTEACDKRCSTFGSCITYEVGPQGGSIAVTSEAVGALCNGQWYRSMAACQSGCGGGACKSFRIGCDKRCQ